MVAPGDGGASTDSHLPKNYVSWDIAVQFCKTLSVQEGLTPAYTIHGPNGDVTWHQDANGYRLPTEAEWEYACRATTTMAYHNDTNCLHSTTEANFRGNGDQLPGCPTGIYRQAPIEVGSFPANQWGCTTCTATSGNGCGAVCVRTHQTRRLTRCTTWSLAPPGWSAAETGTSLSRGTAALRTVTSTARSATVAATASGQ